MPPRQDLVTTSFTFTVPNSSFNQSTSYGLAAFPSFAGYVYTSAEDLLSGTFADETSTLLVTEGVFGSSFARKAFFDPRTNAAVVLFNENKTEKFLKGFAKRIQKAIFKAYGLTQHDFPHLDDGYIDLISEDFGLKKEFEWFTFTPKYDTMPAIMLRTINGLYLQENNVTNDEDMPCCC